MCNVNFSDITDFQELDSAFRYEITWLEQVFDSLQNYSTNDEATCNGWAAHHVSKKRGSKYPPRINTISPPITDKVATLNTEGYCMLENVKCTKIINPNQAPVNCCDEPVFTLTKELQFRFPKMFQNYFPLFEGLHIEQSLLVVHGQLIKGSGLMEILNLQKLSTIGLSVVADEYYIKRATYCIPVTLSTPYIKLNEATSLDKLNSACPYD